ncbi:MAG TPA: GNAT family N-acetyltransferase [Kofleriaceae bacterium]
MRGEAIAANLDVLAELRIRVFREFPYLYEGSLEYEAKYLGAYAESPKSLVVIARDGERIVGAATAMPLAVHTDNVMPALIAAGYAPDRVYYFGESVLDADYRGRGIGHAFLDEREAVARELGYATAAFCAVERPADHPARPAGYRSLHELWTKHGFRQRPEIVTTFEWKDLGDAEETPKKMIFWTKELS